MRLLACGGSGLLASALAALFMTGTAWGAAGDFDHGFAMGAVATAPFSTPLAGGGVAPAADGSIYVEGQTVPPMGEQTKITVTRFDNAGNADPCFGSADCHGTGTILVPPGTNSLPGQDYTGASIAVGSSGPQGRTDMIYAAGALKVGSFFVMGVARLFPDGTLDSTFGAHGIVTLDPCNGLGSSSVASIEVHDDVVLLVGTAQCFAGTGDQVAVAELRTTSGQPAAFGTGGVTLLPGLTDGYDGTIDVGTSTAPGTNKVLVAGEQTGGGCGAGPCFLVARLNPDGSVDNTFGPSGNGMATYAVNGSQISHAYDVAFVGSGKAVVSGACNKTTGDPVSSSWYLCALRLTTSGALDPGFGSGGVLWWQTNHNVGSQTMAVQKDGKLVFGSVGPLVARATADGQPDPTFGTGGLMTDFKQTGAVNGVTVYEGTTIQRIYVGGALGTASNPTLFAAALTMS